MKKYLLLAVCLILSGCLEVENSSSQDSGGLTLNPDDSPEFAAAKTLFSTSCGGSGCHNNYSSFTEAQFIAQGLVVAGDPDASRVFCRNAGSTGACSGDSKTMPLSRPALTVQQLQVISDWITNITP